MERHTINVNVKLPPNSRLVDPGNGQQPLIVDNASNRILGVLQIPQLLSASASAQQAGTSNRPVHFSMSLQQPPHPAGGAPLWSPPASSLQSSGQSLHADSSGAQMHFVHAGQQPPMTRLAPSGPQQAQQLPMAMHPAGPLAVQMSGIGSSFPVQHMSLVSPSHGSGGGQQVMLMPAQPLPAASPMPHMPAVASASSPAHLQQHQQQMFVFNSAGQLTPVHGNMQQQPMQQMPMPQHQPHQPVTNAVSGAGMPMQQVQQQQQAAGGSAVMMMPIGLRPGGLMQVQVPMGAMLPTGGGGGGPTMGVPLAAFTGIRSMPGSSISGSSSSSSLVTMVPQIGTFSAPSSISNSNSAGPSPSRPAGSGDTSVDGSAGVSPAGPSPVPHSATSMRVLSPTAGEFVPHAPLSSSNDNSVSPAPAGTSSGGGGDAGIDATNAFDDASATRQANLLHPASLETRGSGMDKTHNNGSDGGTGSSEQSAIMSAATGASTTAVDNAISNNTVARPNNSTSKSDSSNSNSALKMRKGFLLAGEPAPAASSSSAAASGAALAPTLQPATATSTAAAPPAAPVRVSTAAQQQPAPQPILARPALDQQGVKWSEQQRLLLSSPSLDGGGAWGDQHLDGGGSGGSPTAASSSSSSGLQLVALLKGGLTLSLGASNAATQQRVPSGSAASILSSRYRYVAVCRQQLSLSSSSSSSDNATNMDVLPSLPLVGARAGVGDSSSGGEGSAGAAVASKAGSKGSGKGKATSATAAAAAAVAVQSLESWWMASANTALKLTGAAAFSSCTPIVVKAATGTGTAAPSSSSSLSLTFELPLPTEAGRRIDVVVLAIPVEAKPAAVASAFDVAIPPGPSSGASSPSSATITIRPDTTTKQVFVIGAVSHTTAASAPDPPSALAVVKGSGGAAGKTTLKLRWSAPDDRGSAITRYTVEAAPVVDASPSPGKDGTTGGVGDRNDWFVVYEGGDRSCEHRGLRPGQGHMYRVKAMNPVGESGWSSSIIGRTEAGAPTPPSPPHCDNPSPTSLALAWSPPAADNGAAVVEYHLEWAKGRPSEAYSQWAAGTKGSPAAPTTSPATTTDSSTSAEDDSPASSAAASASKLSPPPQHGLDFATLYRGPDVSYTMRDLTPESSYSFRLAARNTAGSSLPSAIVSFTCPGSAPACPGAVIVSEECAVTSTSTASTPSPLSTPWLLHASLGTPVTRSGDVRLWWKAVPWVGSIGGGGDGADDGKHVGVVQYTMQVATGVVVMEQRPQPQPAPAAATGSAGGKGKSKGKGGKQTGQPQQQSSADAPAALVPAVRMLTAPLAIDLAASTSYTLRNLTPGGLYMARVCSRNHVGSSEYGAWLTFACDAAAPGQIPRLSAGATQPVQAVMSATGAASDEATKGKRKGGPAPSSASSSSSTPPPRFYSSRCGVAITMALPANHGSDITSYLVQASHVGPALAPLPQHLMLDASGTSTGGAYDEDAPPPTVEFRSPPSHPPTTTSNTGSISGPLRMPVLLHQPHQGLLDTVLSGWNGVGTSAEAAGADAGQVVADGNAGIDVAEATGTAASTLQQQHPWVAIGAACDATYHEDGMRYPGTITDITAVAGGEDDHDAVTVTVHLPAFGLDITCGLADLRPRYTAGDEVSIALQPGSPLLLLGSVTGVTEEGYAIAIVGAIDDGAAVVRQLPSSQVQGADQATPAIAHAQRERAAAAAASGRGSSAAAAAAAAKQSQTSASWKDMLLSAKPADAKSTLQKPLVAIGSKGAEPAAAAVSADSSGDAVAPSPDVDASSAPPSKPSKGRKQHHAKVAAPPTYPQWYLDLLALHHPTTVASSSSGSEDSSCTGDDAGSSFVHLTSVPVSALPAPSQDPVTGLPMLHLLVPPASSAQHAGSSSAGGSCNAVMTGCGLLSGHSYQIRVCAVNNHGQGPWSQPADVVCQPGNPTAPTSVQLALSNSNATSAGNTAGAGTAIEVTVSPPFDDCGSRVAGYVVQVADGTVTTSDASGKTAPTWRTVHTGPLPPSPASLGSLHYTITAVPGQQQQQAQPLRPGWWYHVRVAAINGIGISAFTALSSIRTPARPPSAPQKVKSAAVSSAAALAACFDKDRIGDSAAAALLLASSYRRELDPGSLALAPATTASTKGSQRQAGGWPCVALLSWDPPSDDNGCEGGGVEGYEVEVAMRGEDDSNDGFCVLSSDVDNDGGGGISTAPVSLSCPLRTRHASLVLAALRPGRSYTIRVRAVTSAGAGEWSPPSSFTSPPDVPAPVQPPTQLAGDDGSASSHNSVCLIWTAPPSSSSSPVTGYLLQRVRLRQVPAAGAAGPSQAEAAAVADAAVAAGQGVVTVAIPSEELSPSDGYAVTKLQAGTMYAFRCAAVNAAGHGPWGAWGTVVTAHAAPAGTAPSEAGTKPVVAAQASVKPTPSAASVEPSADAGAEGEDDCVLTGGVTDEQAADDGDDEASIGVQSSHGGLTGTKAGAAGKPQKQAPAVRKRPVAAPKKKQVGGKGKSGLRHGESDDDDGDDDATDLHNHGRPRSPSPDYSKTVVKGGAAVKAHLKGLKKPKQSMRQRVYGKLGCDNATGMLAWKLAGVFVLMVALVAGVWLALSPGTTSSPPSTSAPDPASQPQLQPLAQQQQQQQPVLPLQPPVYQQQAQAAAAPKSRRTPAATTAASKKNTKKKA